MSPRSLLPMMRHEIDGCTSCPLRVGMAEEGAYLDESDFTYKCGHPGSPERDVTEEQGIPDFCPLIDRPLRLCLSKEALDLAH